MQGASGHADLVQLKNREDKRFKLAIKATRPVFVPFEDAQADKIKKWRAQNGVQPAASGGQLTATPAALSTIKTAPAVEPLESALQAFSFTAEPQRSSPPVRSPSSRARSARSPEHKVGYGLEPRRKKRASVADEVAQLLALEEVSEEEIRVLADRAYKANQLDHYVRNSWSFW